MDDDDFISIGPGDQVRVVRDEDLGQHVIRIQNAAFAERPRWLWFETVGKVDRERQINELIHALEQLRATER